MLFGISFKGTGLGKREMGERADVPVFSDLNCNRFLSNHN